ncbi:MAG: right-handed parallel beta-helix repeat-containing protein [Candidatus Aenigmarchaeota archaeon]|nr:right-handed parallel beta-helix repeat-containing protein [Candidatus Aenigmarchaeota archaeon]
MRAIAAMLCMAVVLSLAPLAAAANGCGRPGDVECGSSPVNNCDVTRNTSFTPGIYSLPGGIDMCASYVRLQCNGAELRGAGSGSGIGINSSTRNVTIEGCTVSLYNNGIYVGGNYNTVANSTSKDNKADGIYLVDYNVARNNTLRANGGAGIAIYFDNGNILDSNVAEGNAMGIYIHWAGGNTLRNNAMSGNTHNLVLADSQLGNSIDTSNTVNGRPVYVLQNIRNQVFDRSANPGILICSDCDNITVRDLSFTGNDPGLYLSYVRNSLIVNVTASSNWADGIVLTGGSANNTVMGSAASMNRFAGIAVYYSSVNNTIEGNEVVGNTGGINVYKAQRNRVINNTVRGDKGFYGAIVLSESSLSMAVNNTVTGSSYNGMSISDSASATVSGNNVSLNGGHGIVLGGFGADQNSINHNTVSANGKHGIYIAFSFMEANTLLTNTICGNNRAGSYVDLYNQGQTNGGNNTCQTSVGWSEAGEPGCTYLCAYPGLTVVTRGLPAGLLGEFSRVQLEARGGVPPYRWSLAGGSLPGGVVLHPDGVLNGTPTESGNFSFAAKVEDANASQASKPLVLTIWLSYPQPLLHVEKWGPTPVPGRTLTYYILAENRGSEPALSHMVFESLEPWFSFVSADPSPTNLTEGGIFWELSPLQPGGSLLLSYTVQLNITTPNGATVRGPACPYPWFPVPPNTPIPPPPSQVVLPLSQCITELSDCLLKIPFTCLQACVSSPEECAQCYSKEALVCWLEYEECLNGITSPQIPLPELSCDIDEEPVRTPIDPNEKESMQGRFIRPGQTLTYLIHFENVGTVEARDVFITDQLDSRAFNTSTVRILSGNGTFNPQTGVLRWTLVNISLPPNGTGTVLFSVKPVSGLPSGSNLSNNASIQFEAFPPVVTNSTLHTIDDVPPSCAVDPLPNVTYAENFTLSWGGTDPLGEIALYDIFVAEEGSGFRQIIAGNFSLNATSGTFTGTQGRTYAFICIAQDTAGNVELQPPVPEARIRVNGPPAILSAPPLFSRQGAWYAYNILAVDGENDTLTYSLPTSPSGMLINASTGAILWRVNVSFPPPPSFNISLPGGGSGVVTQHPVVQVPVEAQATDSAGLFAVQAWNITIGQSGRLVPS